MPPRLCRRCLSHSIKMRSLALSDTEAYLGMIWAHVLGIEGVGADDDFFERGGNSLSAVAMVLEVEKAFDVKISAQSIWETPRLQDLAALIDEARFKPDELGNTSIVHPMLKTGDDRAIFLSGIGFKPTDKIARQLGCSLYGLSQWAHGIGFVKADTITDLARAQVAEIRRIQPEGPYRLAGYSLGGLIVLEIAQQIREAGGEVELLFLLDPMMPPYYQLGSNVAVECAPAYVPTPTERHPQNLHACDPAQSAQGSARVLVARRHPKSIVAVAIVSVGRPAWKEAERRHPLALAKASLARLLVRGETHSKHVCCQTLRRPLRRSLPHE